MQNWSALPLFLLGMVSTSLQAATTETIPELMARIRTTDFNGQVKKLASQPKVLDSTAPWMDRLQSDGTWPDIDYVVYVRDATKKVIGSKIDALHHVDRLAIMSWAYVLPASKWYNSAPLKIALQKALEAYVAKNPFYAGASWEWTEWFNRVVVEDGRLSTLLLALDGKFPLANLQAWTKPIENETEARMTNGLGANLYYELRPRMIREYFWNKYDLVEKYAKMASLEITPRATGEGMRLDGSFDQHSLVYSGRYGRDLVNGSLDWLEVFDGTQRAYPTSVVHALVDHILDGSARMARNNQYDLSSIGRTIGVPAGATPYDLANGPRLTKFGYRAEELTQASNWAQGKGSFPWPSLPSKAFWHFDYITHNRDEATVTYKMTSSRIRRSESFSGTNLKGFYLGEGVSWIYTGLAQQYNGNILAAMDWTLLPGVTTDSTAVPPSMETPPNISQWTTETKIVNGSIPGLNAFKGAVDNGVEVVVAHDFNAGRGITGKKAVFFLDTSMVFLGAGFNFDVATNVRTSVNQIKSAGDILLYKSGVPTTFTAETIQGNDIKGVYNDSVAYLFPRAGASSVVLTNKTFSGNWDDINTADAGLNGVVSEKLFQLYLNHGKKAIGADFQYAVLPGVSRQQATNWINKPNFVVNANTAKIQSVSQPLRGWHGAVFYNADSVVFAGGLQLKASRACAVMVRTSNDSIKLWVSDPSHATAPINISLGVELLGIDYNNNKWSQQTITLPTAAGFEGSSAYKGWRLKNPITGTTKSKAFERRSATIQSDGQILVFGAPGSYALRALDSRGRVARQWQVQLDESGKVEFPSGLGFNHWLLDWQASK